ncbi:MAG: hypothetical protein IT229_02830, partial [Flavobacteriales bacterium]|nr:hypothetical protein [Flavobacteriales bacterium]
MRKALRLRTLSSIVVLGLVSGAQAQNVGINVTGAAPNASALLDLDVSGLPAAGKRGLLIPRMLRSDRLAIPAPTAGLWVYQTDDVTAPVFDPSEEHGFWYYEGPPTNAWVRWAPGRNAWTLNGNAGTTPTLNYLGTIGATPLNFRTVTPATVDPQMQILGTTRYMGINTVGAPLERLDVNGAMRVISSGAGAGSATNQEGSIRFTASATAPNRWHFGSTPMVTRSGNTTLGSPTVTMTSTAGLAVGMTITGTGIPPGTTIAAIVNATTVTLSVNATATLASQFFGMTAAPGNWARLENAEALVTAGGDYAKDTLTCPVVPSPGFAVVGPQPGSNSVSNAQTPVPTNATAVFPIPCGSPFTLICNTTLGSTTVTTASTVGLAANYFVIGAGIPANARVASVVNATTLTLTAAATATAAGVTLTFTGFANTAYSTAWTGVFANTTGRGYRAQYIYTAAELTAAGLCEGYITSFGWYALDDDCNGGPSSPFTQGKIQIEARIGTTAVNDFTTAPGTWVEAVRTSAIRNTTFPNPPTPTQTIVVSGGWNQIPLNINPLAPGGLAGYYWDGVSNIVLDWCWVKQPADGRSPRVWVHTPALQPRTRFMRHPSAANGNLYDDSPVAPSATTAIANELTRPVTRFGGNIKTTSYTASTANYIHYAGGLMIADAAWAATNYRGPGTISAQQGVYDGNSLLNDHVFDKYFDGTVREEDAAAAAT